MVLPKDVAIQQIEAAHEAYNEARGRSQYNDLGDLSEAEISRIVTLLDATIDRLAPPDSRYRRQANDIVAKAGGHNSVCIPVLLGAVLALRSDYQAGYLQTFQELIHAAMFADFLEMADYLLYAGYKEPAVVLAGGVLEEHLRQLCGKAGIPVEQAGRPRKADALNSDLASARSYSVLDQKNVTAWLDLRNKAAHGKHTEYTKEQVPPMLLGIREFLTRHPA